MKRIGKIIQRAALLLSLLIIIVMSSGCTVDAAVPILNPPRALRFLSSADISPLGNLPDPYFVLDAITNKPRIQSFYSDTKFIDGVDVGDGSCIAIEFYAYNVEQGFNGYNIYAMGGHVYADLAEAWQDYVANLKLYQSAHSGPAPANTFYPVAPGTIDSPYYASIASNTISFSGGLTKIVAVFNHYKNYGTNNAFLFGAGPYYIGVTAVSITEGSIYESLPSNIIQLP